MLLIGIALTNSLSVSAKILGLREDLMYLSGREDQRAAGLVADFAIGNRRAAASR